MKSRRRATRGSRHLYRLCFVDGALDETRVRQVARGLAASRRRAALAVLTAFNRLVRLHRERHTARIESAALLPAELREHVDACLHRIYGSRLDTSFAQNPALIGGIRITVGSDVYDDSVRGRLAALEALL
jgi:F-type H+-transporting ATPase subunit delta